MMNQIQQIKKASKTEAFFYGLVYRKTFSLRQL